MLAVDEYQSVAVRFGERKLVKRLDVQRVFWFLENRIEGQTGNRRDIGVAPVFVAEGWPAGFCEARHGCLSHGKEP